jgi:ribosomal protein L37E
MIIVPHSTHTFIKCRHCGHEVFRGAKRCPSCRHRLHRTRHIWYIAAIASVLMTLAVANWMSKVEGPPEPREAQAN